MSYEGRGAGLLGCSCVEWKRRQVGDLATEVLKCLLKSASSLLRILMRRMPVRYMSYRISIGRAGRIRASMRIDKHQRCNVAGASTKTV